jgi:hypothetical protein
MRIPFACLALSVLLAPAVLAQAPAAAARPFPLGDVQLLDSPFKRAMERNAAYLLSLEPDRLLHNFREYAGLKPKAEKYGGWESLGLAGHTLGHYLTALSQQFAATGDARFKARIDYIVSELALCQAAYGDGYVGGLPPLEFQTIHDFGKGVVELQGPHNFKGGAWVPWYTEHKVLNGLKDAWGLAGNTQARDVALRLADWTGAVTAGLSQEQLQTMLAVEHGGMMDTLVELYALTGDTRYLETSRRFYHKAVFDPLLAQRDELPGLHANTQIPKIIGEARTYEVTGNADGRAIASYFWELVTHHYSYVIGGDSEDEHFFPGGRHVPPPGTGHGGDLQHLQHAQVDRARLRVGAEGRVCRLLRARALQPHPGVAGTGRGHVHVFHVAAAGLLQDLQHPQRLVLVLRGHGHGEPHEVRRGHLLPRQGRPLR